MKKVACVVHLGNGNKQRFLLWRPIYLSDLQEVAIFVHVGVQELSLLTYTSIPLSFKCSLMDDTVLIKLSAAS